MQIISIPFGALEFKNKRVDISPWTLLLNFADNRWINDKIREYCKNFISNECVSSKLKTGIEISIRIGMFEVSIER